MKKPKKFITYVLMVSRNFPAYHPRAGETTDFPNMIVSDDKIHTCRGNYKLWAKRAEKVNAGLAIISLRYWMGKPYKSKQIEFSQLTSLNVQKVHIYQVAKTIGGHAYDKASNGKLNLQIHTQIFIENSIVPLRHPFKFAAHDGLSLSDFNAWFKKPLEDGAILQFTDFLYTPVI